jgi:hypothetical protein
MNGRGRTLAAAATVALLALPALPARAAVEVKLRLPVRARIDLTNKNSLAPAPFIVVTREGGGDRGTPNLNLQQEFERYLTKVLRRETNLRIVETGPVDYPSYDLDVLARNREFWQSLGERTHADLIVAGSLDFDIQDKSGYRTEEYVSPFDGRIYYRQVLVEQTGFDYDIAMMVFDGKTGDRLFFDNFKDFKQFEGESADPMRGMFENLSSLEDRIVGVFAQKSVETSRVLLTD